MEDKRIALVNARFGCRRKDDYSLQVETESVSDDDTNRWFQCRNGHIQKC